MSRLVGSTLSFLLLVFVLGLTLEQSRGQSPGQSSGQTAAQTPPPPAPTLTIDAASPTGAVRHGATGWLYGQSEPGIPPQHMMELLRPQISAQKPPAGLQHPGGDAFEVMPSFKAAGGRLMQIYIQDIYTDWPYNQNGLDDYMAKVAEVAHKVVADPNRASFVYVPFNEPDNNWYGYEGPKFDRFLHDWLAVYREIRSIDSTAKIAGPNYEHLKPATYEAFFTFARDHHALPDETTWHELHDDFFTGWYQRYDGYRAMEKRLGIAPVPVVINEYTRDRGDLAVPGNLVQWITRLESSKVDGCLAFWTPNGTMSDLTARTWPNRATGGWWVYYWYAEMTGQTLKAAPPDLNAFGLQGIASADGVKKQLRVLFGGTGSGIDLNITGLSALPYFQKSAQLALWRVDSSGIGPSQGPQLVSQANLPIAAGSVRLSVPAADATSAYYAVLTPALTPTTADVTAGQADVFPAIYATLSGGAAPAYRLPSGSVIGLGRAAAVTFPITASQDGYYTATLRYVLHGRTPATAHLSVNGANMQSFRLTAGLRLIADPPNQPWAEAKATLFLAGGINAFQFSTLSRGDARADTRHDGLPGAGLEILSLRIQPAAGVLAAYPAADTGNTLGRGAVAHHDDAGRTWVSLPAGDQPSSLRFNYISVPVAGEYKLIVTYSNDERAHGGTVDESTRILVNGSRAISTYFRQTFGAAILCTKVIDVPLKAGNNTLEIAAFPGRQGPNVAQIQVAKARLD